jgi:hypothetical protein
MKYSNETVAFGRTWNDALTTDETFAFPVCSPSEVQGTRKAKNFTIKATLLGSNAGCAICALVYLPEGLKAVGGSGLNSGNGSGIQTTAVSLYEPSQNVISSWVMNYSTSTPVTITSRLARNLNSGDSIWLLVRPLNALTSGGALQFNFTANFALGYN